MQRIKVLELEIWKKSRVSYCAMIMNLWRKMLGLVNPKAGLKESIKGMIEVPQSERQLNPNLEQIIGDSVEKKRGNPLVHVVKFSCCVSILAKCLRYHYITIVEHDWFCSYIELYNAIPIISQDHCAALFQWTQIRFLLKCFCQISESRLLYRLGYPNQS